jgi:soluble lytic murein transglycosylase
MSRRLASILALGAVAGLSPGALEAGTFRHVDEAGVVHYTNVPPDARYQQIPEPALAPRTAEPPASPALARFAEHIRATSARYGVDHRLVEAVIVVESGGNPRAVSPKGATGLMQLMPQRAALLGVRNAFDPYQNLDGGIRHLRDLLERFDGDVALALAAYNAGEEAVRSYRGIPPYRETQHYVRRIRALYGAAGLPLDGGTLAPPRPGPAPVYETVQADGSVVYTNLPPR